MTRPIVTFTVLGDPRPLALKRARAAHHGRMVIYDPPQNISAKEQVKHVALAAFYANNNDRPPVPCPGSIIMAMTAYVPIPKSFSKKKRAAAIAETLWPKTKPDMTNVVKLVEDALNQVIYRDDKQIGDGGQRKRYSERPRLEVEISEYTGGAT